MLGSQVAMPILVINMGGEMIYILHQRLQAQNIPEEKARKVLEDVIRTMYTPAFLDELFKPQEIYSNASTKQIFDKLAHSSIMRLNKTSMEKLYDLMTMGVKYQLLSCACPQQYLQITLQHLDALNSLVHNDSVSPLLQSAITRSIHMYTQLTGQNWLLLQQTLLQFFQGRKVKVSLFLQQNLQTANGILILHTRGKLPFYTEKPGQIRYYENNNVIRSSYFSTEFSDSCFESSEVMDFHSNMGKNMYVKQLDEKSSSSRSPSFVEAEAAFARFNNAMPVSPAAAPKVSANPSSASQAKYSSQASAKAELSVLAELLGANDLSSPAKGAKGDDKNVRLHFNASQGFAKDDFDNEKGEDNYGSADSNFIVIDIDATAGVKTVQKYMEDLDLKDDAKASAKGVANDDDDDLLALMDSAK